MLLNAYIRRSRALQRVKELRSTGMLRLRKLNRLCSRMASDTANRLRKTRKKRSSAVLLFEAVTCRQSAPVLEAKENKENKNKGKPQINNNFCPRCERR